MTNRRMFIAAAALLAGCGGGGEQDVAQNLAEAAPGTGPAPGPLNLLQAQASLVQAQASLAATTLSAFDSVCATARHAVVWSDAAMHEGRYAPNRATGVTPTRNLLAFSTGPLVNESGGQVPVKTNCYISWTDAAGTSFATRLQSTAANQFFFLYRSSVCPAIPSGTYGLRFRCRATPGRGDQPVSFGLTTSPLTRMARDWDWTQSLYTGATTFSLQFTYSGSGDIAIRLPTAGMDILVDRLQLYFGGLAVIPPWAHEAERLQGGRKGFSFPGAISLDAQGHWNQVANSGGGWILEPGLADHTYANGVTILHACALDDLETAAGQSIAYGVATRKEARLGTTPATLHLGFDTNFGVSQGQVKYSPSTEFREQSSFQALNHGIVLLGQALDGTGRRMFVNEIPVLTEPVPFAPLTVDSWHVGAGSNVDRAHVIDFELVGRHALTLIWDRALSNDEWAAAAQVVLNYLAGKGTASFPDFHVFSGDSNWTKADGDVMQLLSADGFLAPGRNLWARDTSVGGTGIAEVYGSAPYPAPMDPAGRLLATEVPIMQYALQAGRKVVYHLLVGTNDFIEISGPAAWGVAAYCQTRQAIVDYLLGLHPNVWVVEYTIVAAGSGSGRRYTAQVREDVNARRRAAVAARADPRHRLCDLGGPDCVLGDQTTADAGTYLLEPAPGGIHFNRHGDAAAAAFIRPHLLELRAAMGS